LPARTYDNGPLEGFYIGRSVNHSSSWNRCSDKWRIEDPRGFELEVPSGNLEEIVRTCTIVDGKIEQPCIWARMGAINILVPAHTELYKKALENTVRSKTKASITDAKPGDTVVLQNGRQGTYMGHYYFVQGTYNGINGSGFGCYTSIVCTTNKRYVFRYSNDKYFSFANIKVAEVIDGEDIADPVDEINTKIINRASYNTIENTVDYNIIGVTPERFSASDFTHCVLPLSVAREIGHGLVFIDNENDSTALWGTGLNPSPYYKGEPEWKRFRRNFVRDERGRLVTTPVCLTGLRGVRFPSRSHRVRNYYK